jgi:hypothetical protein
MILPCPTREGKGPEAQQGEGSNPTQAVILSRPTAFAAAGIATCCRRRTVQPGVRAWTEEDHSSLHFSLAPQVTCLRCTVQTVSLIEMRAANCSQAGCHTRRVVCLQRVVVALARDVQVRCTGGGPGVHVHRLC